MKSEESRTTVHTYWYESGMFAFTLLYILSLYQKSYRSSFKRKENIYKRGGGSDYVDSVNLTHCLLVDVHCYMLDASICHFNVWAGPAPFAFDSFTSFSIGMG